MTVNGPREKGEAFTVEESEQGMRLDAFIASHMPDYVSRSRVKDIIKTIGVHVGNTQNKEPNYRIKMGEVIHVEVPEPEDAVPKAEDIPLDVFFEDDHLLIINKPAGMVVHPAIGHWSGTMVNALLHHCGNSLSGIGGVRRPGIVHRLDKETSGLLVVAKTEQAHAGLTAQFMDHGRTGPLERVYLALVWGRFERMTGTVSAPLARSPNNRKKRAVVKETHSEAKEAITHFTVRSEFGLDEDGFPLASLVECRLETGRTHQIRVHMSHIGHPLVGDQEYGKHFQTKENKLPEATQKVLSGFKRQALHAAILGFEHPVTGETIRFESQIPDDFQMVLRAFEQISPEN
ncbi:MAG: RluA family pseudouridine synthase [Rhizobiaceae bacterium]|nr:RluA family pseudouridine synthase [Rhizobiaceae bacterium]